jgi:hypothetical protein
LCAHAPLISRAIERSGTCNWPSLQVLTRLSEWLFRSREIRDARARLPPDDDPRIQAARQARLLLEVAHRVAEPVEVLPDGCRAAVRVALYREALPWALVAAGPPGGAPNLDLRTLWSEQRSERLGSPEHGADSVKALLVDATGPAALDATEAQADRAGAFVESLSARIDAPIRQLGRLRVQRSIRVVAAAAALALLAVGVRSLVLGPDLAKDKPFRTSSSWSGCASDPPCTRLMFHTETEDNPWVELDLGAVQAVHRVEVANRTDCCSDRAVPLLVEVGVDRDRWTEVARRQTTFSTWTTTFPRQNARYVRLRVPRSTPFHLEAISVR